MMAGADRLPQGRVLQNRVKHENEHRGGWIGLKYVAEINLAIALKKGAGRKARLTVESTAGKPAE